jgi:hypothetical protein
VWEWIKEEEVAQLQMSKASVSACLFIKAKHLTMPGFRKKNSFYRSQSGQRKRMLFR